MKTRSLALAAWLTLALLLSAVAQAQETKQSTSPKSTAATKTASTQNIVASAERAGSFKTFLQAVQTADLTKWLEEKGPYTVFAPTDDAFAKLPNDQLDALMKDKAKLTEVVKYHVVSGSMSTTEIAALNGRTLKTENGKSISVGKMQDKLMLDSGMTTGTELKCKNGVIHPIDTVLLMPSSPAPQAAPQQPKY